MPYNLILNWSGPSRKHPSLGANLLPSLLKATRGRKDLFHLSIPLLHSIPEGSQGMGTQGGNLEAGTQAEAMEEHCFL